MFMSGRGLRSIFGTGTPRPMGELIFEYYLSFYFFPGLSFFPYLLSFFLFLLSFSLKSPDFCSWDFYGSW